MTGAQVLVRTLVELGVDTIFGYPGGAVLPIYDALFGDCRIRHILVRHEAAAAHAAEGYARSTGRPGVVLVTSGPGLTNTVTGLADALMDSIPIVILSGQVATHLIGTDAFQECDTVGITRHCTKHNYLIKTAAHLEVTLRDAFHIAASGRPGPVVVDIPKDVQVARAPWRGADVVLPSSNSYRPSQNANADAIGMAVDLLSRAKRPVFYTGGGVINAGADASRLLREIALETGAPVTSTLMGLGAFPASSPQWLGMLGMHGTYEANMAMHEADLVVAVGARFDDRVTGRLDAFSPRSRRVHIDIDRSSIGKTVRADVGIVADAGQALDAMIKLWRGRGHVPINLEPWWRRIAGWRARDCLAFDSPADVIAPQAALRALWRKVASRDPIITTEVGQHQMWAAQHLGFQAPRRWLTSGGFGTMGYGLPAAIGAQVAHPDALVIDISGDASFQMNMQEMATARQYRLPVKIFMLNNEHLGMVRQLQDVGYGGRYAASYSDSLPDFVALAEAYGWTGLRIDHPGDLENGIDRMLATQGAVLVDIRVARFDNVYPMVPGGAAHIDMLFGPKDTSAPTPEEAGALL
ncbi:biosynthetic-type acetolactate synthase large subunit [Sphingobium fuliginis ATCC 27551]|uniref:Acetolactate synthase n=2 Tax=Sphingobium fuliginis (strain ATCC 27551) TaxID=336203 RepID=A0A5B8CLE8_SPHSA|nr:biosynthetic-type acetolactate synthase large subunit [Sphingobium fuliginis ATCC 27551]